MNRRATARAMALASFAALCAALACARGPGGAAADSPSVSTADSARPGPAPSPAAAGSLERVQQLETEARALARAEGCEQAAQCRAAPVGSRPCGGPRDFIVYCALTTDSAALFRKLAEVEAAERAYNEQAGLASTCELRMAPPVRLAGGRCAAEGGNNGPRVP